MSLQKKNIKRKQRRKLRTRRSLTTDAKLRASVFRSAKHIYGQIIDDNKATTVTSYSTLQLKDPEGDKKAQAHLVGVELAKKALEKGVEEVVFDKGPFLYHGRVQSFAEGLREGGLVF